MDITKWCFVVITYRIICGYVCNCLMVWGMYILVFMCIYAMKDWYVHNICFFHIFAVMITFQRCYGYNKVMYCCYHTQDNLWLLWLLFIVVMDITKWCIVVISHRTGQRYRQTVMSGLPQERNGDWENYNYHGGNEVSDIFMNMFTSLLWI